jgi:hypothetical protein
MLQTALLTGQDAIDSLPDDVKKIALGAAERSLAPGRGDYSLTEEEMESPDREGFTPIAEVAPPEQPERGEYKLTEKELASPDREGFTPVPGIEPPKKPEPREEYKSFRMPAGLSPEKQSAWKSAIDDSVLEQGSYNAEQARFEAGRQQFFEESDKKATDALGSLFAAGTAGAIGTGGAKMAGAVLGASDDALTGSAEAVAQKGKMGAMGKLGSETKALNKAEKALEAAMPKGSLGVGYKAQGQANQATDSILKNMSPGTVYEDLVGEYRVSPGGSKIDVPKGYGLPGEMKTAARLDRDIGNVLDAAVSKMPKISSDEVNKGIKAATDAKDLAATTLEASKSAYKDVAARATALQDAKLTTGLKIFGAKAAGTAAIASSPALGAAVSALGIPIIAMSEMAKHGKIDDMLQTMSYRLLERPVSYGDVGDSVHSYLVQNPTEAEELFSKGVIDGDYYEWVAESANQ